MYRVSTGVTFGQGALSTFPLAYLFKIAHGCFECLGKCITVNFQTKNL